MTTEKTYRHLVRAFPSRWRDENEEELIGTLLEVDNDRKRVGVADAANLVFEGFRMRLQDRRSAMSAADGDRSRPTRTRGLSSIVALGLSVFVALLLLQASSGGVSPEFLATSLVVVMVPGTGVVYTVSSALTGGYRRGSIAAFGCTLGIVSHMAAAMLGLSGVVQAGATAFEVVRWAGVAYLVFMGVSMIRDGGVMKLDAPERSMDESALLIVRRGILLNLLNPKLTVFFFAFLPQFLDSRPVLFDIRLVGLGAVFMVMTFVVFVVYAYACAAVRERVFGDPTVLRWVQRALGTLLVGFAARLALADR